MKKKFFIFVLFIFLFLILSAQTGNLDFSYTPVQPKVGEEVKFYNHSASFDSFNWSFGDGYYNNNVQPVHTYENSGNYKVVLTGIRNGLRNEINKNVIISPNFEQNELDVEISWSPKNPYVDEVVRFQFNTEQAISNFYWEFSDDKSHNAQSPVHTYDNSGEYLTQLTFFHQNVKHNVQKTLTVHNKPLLILTGEERVGYVELNWELHDVKNLDNLILLVNGIKNEIIILHFNILFDC